MRPSQVGYHARTFIRRLETSAFPGKQLEDTDAISVRRVTKMDGPAGTGKQLEDYTGISVIP